MKLAVYGTLRLGGGLHDYYLRGLEPVKTQMLRGYKMYSLGAFPYVARGWGRILIEVYEVPETTYVDIAHMEMGAGYGIDVVQTAVGEARLFVFSKSEQQAVKQYGQTLPIGNGDWLNHVRRTKHENYVI